MLTVTACKLGVTPPRAAGGPGALPSPHSPAPRHPQQQHLAHLEEKLRLLAQARDEAQSTCLQQKQVVAEAQARASQLGLQLEGLRRRLEELQQVVGTGGLLGVPLVPSRHLTPCTWQDLSNKDQEKVAEVTRVRVELQEQIGRLQAELTAQEALKEKVAALERQLKGELSPSPASGSKGPFLGCRAEPGPGLSSSKRCSLQGGWVCAASGPLGWLLPRDPSLELPPLQ